MRSNFIVATPSVLNDDLRFQPATEPFHDQAFIPELAVETFTGAVLPRLARLTQHLFQSFIPGPSQQCQADKLGAVVTAQIASGRIGAVGSRGRSREPPGGMSALVASIGCPQCVRRTMLGSSTRAASSATERPNEVGDYTPTARKPSGACVGCGRSFTRRVARQARQPHDSSTRQCVTNGRRSRRHRHAGWRRSRSLLFQDRARRQQRLVFRPCVRPGEARREMDRPPSDASAS